MQPSDVGYEPARRVWNGAVDRYPALIAQCRDASDVALAIRFGREHDLPVAARGGGHNVAGTAVCDEGIVIDLSPMKQLRVDARRRIARAEPGLLWGEFDAGTQAHGLATTAGIVTHTGIAGLTLGGGIGWLMRRHGLTCDNLLSAQVVTADGRVIEASDVEHPDLFWALKGGGGNFGVVTSFEYRLHPVGPAVLAGVVLFPAERSVEVLRWYREFASAAPDELTTIVSFRNVPALPRYPEHLHGRPVVQIGACYAGDLQDGERAVSPLRRFGPPLLDLIAPVPYVEHQAMFDPGVPHGLRYYWQSHYLTDLSDPIVEVIAGRAWDAPDDRSYTIMFQMGGAIRRRSEAEAAFAGREAAYALNINSVWSDPAHDDAQKHWARTFWEAVAPSASPKTYINFLGDEGQERVRAAYGAQTYARLVEVKTRYDPTNVFRLNQNVQPAAAGRLNGRRPA